MKVTEFVFEDVHLFMFIHKINPNRGRSYIDSPDLIKKQKSNNKSYHKKDML